MKEKLKFNHSENFIIKQKKDAFNGQSNRNASNDHTMCFNGQMKNNSMLKASPISPWTDLGSFFPCKALSKRGLNPPLYFDSKKA